MNTDHRIQYVERFNIESLAQVLIRSQLIEVRFRSNPAQDLEGRFLDRWFPCSVMIPVGLPVCIEHCGKKETGDCT
jgi:hypothetical protein